MLNALLVTDCRKPVRRAGPGLRRIFTTIAVYLVKMLGLRVIRFELVIADGPRGRDSAVMANLTEVFSTQTKESSAVKLRIPTDKVVGVRVQFLAIAIAPRLFSVVFPFEVYGARAPVVLLTRDIIAPLEKKNLFARGRECVSQCAAARGRANAASFELTVAGHGGLRPAGVTEYSS